MKWIRSANLKKYDLISAFDDNEILDWTKGPFNVKTGDIVYLYVGAPYSRIMYKTLCIADNIGPTEVIQDKKYWNNPDQFSEAETYLRLKKIKFIDDERLMLDVLNEKELISGRIQGAYKSIKYPELFAYIDDIMKADEISLQDIKLESITSTEKELIAKARIGQSRFRDLLIQKYNCKCALCGMGHEELLIASHIKAWAHAADNERLDVNNGLLLCALHDSVFDKHLISFNENGEILISKTLEDRDRLLLNISSAQRINLDAETLKYMKCHREEFYKKEKM